MHSIGRGLYHAMHNMAVAVSLIIIAVALIIIFCVGAPFGRSFGVRHKSFYDGIEGKGNSDDRRANWC